MDTSEALHTFWYQGKEIHLLSDGRFGIQPEDGDYRSSYDTLAKAQEAIDRRLKTQERTKREKLNIPVYVKIEHHGRYGRAPAPDQYVERTLVGVHAGVGTLLLDPPISKGDIATVYVRGERVKTLLAKEIELENQLEAVRSELQEVTLSDGHSYHGRIDESRHAQIIREIKRKCGVS